MKKETIKSISTFPVNNLYCVFEQDGKFFKNKILSILVSLTSDDQIILTPIQTMDIREGSMPNPLLFDDGGILRIIDENHEWVEIPEFDNKGLNFRDNRYQKIDRDNTININSDSDYRSQFNWDLFYCDKNWPWHLDITGRRFTDPIGEQWYLIAENITDEIANKFMYEFLPNELAFDSENILPKNRPSKFAIKKAWVKFMSKDA